MKMHNFAQIPSADIPRSSFNRSHMHKTTFDAGYLVPFYIDEALPGDTFSGHGSFFARLGTPIVPFMDNLKLDTFYFAVPIRLIWNNWEKFNGAQDDPGDSTDYMVPTMSSPAVTGYTMGTLSDYFGLPTDIAGYSHNSLFHRAYNLIWNEWFRDQNLQDKAVVDKDDGPDTSTDYYLRRRGKRYDYFTSCLPWPQKGSDVTLPIGTTAPIDRISNASTWIAYNTGTNTAAADGSAVITNLPPAGSLTRGGAVGISLDPVGGLEADLSSAAAVTINALREAVQIQRLYERDARGGTRYIEIILSHFGVQSPDARLQRPEYLGGGSMPINVHPIAQTSSTDGTSPQGNLAAFATASGNQGGFSKSFTEHCIVMGLLSVRADLSYQQGLHKQFSRSTRWDFYWPALAHIGEQAVLNKEIYFQGNANDDNVFGYQERYAEYRYKPSMITGAFRSTYAQSLDIWHLAQEFSSLPTLSDTFIQENPPVDRVIATPSEPHFLLDCYVQLKCARPMPVYAVPGLMDHF